MSNEETQKQEVFGTLEINNTPLQDGRGTVIKQFTFGGPNTARDSRMFLHAIELEHLLHIARASKTNRVVLHRAGLVVTTRRSPSGHVYEEFRLVCDHPVKEELPTGVKVNCTNDEAKRMAAAYGVKPSKIII